MNSPPPTDDARETDPAAGSDATAECGAVLSGLGPVPDLLAMGTCLAPARARLERGGGPDGPVLEITGDFADFLDADVLNGLFQQRIAPRLAPTSRVVLTAGTPPGLGLGATLAAGIALLRLAGEVLPRRDPATGCAVEVPPGLLPLLARRVRPERVLAACAGGLWLRDALHPPAARRVSDVPGAIGLVVPDWPRPKNARPPAPASVSGMRAIASAGRLARVIHALASNDPSPLREAASEPLFLPVAAARIPGAMPAVAAAIEAGAHTAFLVDGGPAIGVLAPDPVLPAALDAVTATFSVHGLGARTWRPAQAPLSRNTSR